MLGDSRVPLFSAHLLYEPCVGNFSEEALSKYVRTSERHMNTGNMLKKEALMKD
jgi:hypothetical protein